MKPPVQFTPSEHIGEGVLSKTGDAYTLGFLSAWHIDQIVDLQNSVLNGLKEVEKTFLIKRERSFFEKHFSAGGSMIGITQNGQLIAQSVIVNSGTETILKGVIVDPRYRGNGLMNLMVKTWMNVAKKENRDHVLSEVARENIYSWSVFMKEGLELLGMETDPDDSSEIYNMRADLRGAFEKASSHQNAVLCPANDFAVQKVLLQMGYRGFKFDPDQKIIYFRPPQPVSKKVPAHLKRA